MNIRTTRTLLFGFASATALLANPFVAVAQTSPQDETTQVDEIVVTGTRAVGRTRLDTIAPVDVISAETLTRTGTGTETAAALAAAAPSINFPRPAITDGSDHVRPATLRGLAPDQTLVLINGQRGHISALVNVNGNIGRGSTAFDLNTIPAITLGTVEVLRDGASAQYGADAIAGVINLRLREARSGGGITANYGRYDTEYTTARGDHEATDGETKALAGWVGLPLGDEGFLTLSAELQSRAPTNRSDYVNRAAGALPLYPEGTVIGRFGDPETDSVSGWFNAGAPLGNGLEFYAFGGIQRKNSDAAATARPYNNAGATFAGSPYAGIGYLPIIATEIEDINLYGGLRGEALGFEWDLSAGYGKNSLDYRVENTINISFGSASKTDFDAGGLSYDQFTLGLDGVRSIELGMYEPATLAVGFEYRRETFEVSSGEPMSYQQGPVPNVAVGSQGFPGFSNRNAVEADRSNISAYVDLEGKLSEAFSYGLAGRYEDYSDFGEQFTGKVSARYDFTPEFALRGAVSTGVKAPALQQQFFSYTATNLVANPVVGGPQLLAETSTFQVGDPVAIALGAKPLEAEESVNYSLGGVFRSGGFELTVDAYRIDIDDRIIYSETLGGTGGARPGQSVAQRDLIRAFLTATFPASSVSGARFFLNGVDTTTEGVDIVGRYRLPTDFGRFDFTGAANFNTTEVTATPAAPTNVFGFTPSGAFLFDRANSKTFEQGTPESKLVASIDWTLDGWGASLKGTHYDSVLIASTTNVVADVSPDDYETGDQFLVDLEVRYEFDMGASLALGVNNLTDEYPQFTPAGLNSPTGSVGYPSFSPFGFNGRFLYARVGYNF